MSGNPHRPHKKARPLAIPVTWPYYLDMGNDTVNKKYDGLVLCEDHACHRGYDTETEGTYLDTHEPCEQCVVQHEMREQER